MSGNRAVAVRLEPMTDEDLRASLAQAIPRYADELVHRGLATESRALAESRAEFDQLLPEGLATRHRQFRRVLAVSTGARVGEAWFTVEQRAGKTRFWVDWIFVEPELRRRGFATATLRLLEREAASAGADRIGLSAWTDSPGAIALYSKLGFEALNLRMWKRLPHPASSE